MRRQYVYTIIIKEGSDEAWEEILEQCQDKTGIKAINEQLEASLEMGFGPDNCSIELLSYSK